MKKIGLTAVLISALLITRIEAVSLTFTGKTDKNPIAYRCGEAMKFTIFLVDKDNANQPVKGRRLVWERQGDDGLTVRGEAVSDEALLVTTAIAKPGFVRITVKYLDQEGKPVSEPHTAMFDGGAGADVWDIPACPPPKDFNSFWDQEIDKLLKTPYEVKTLPIPCEDQRLKGFQFDVTVFEGERHATGVVLMPADAKKSSHPVNIQFHGYGFGKSNPDLNAALGGYISAVITRHGEEPLREQEYYSALGNGEMKGFCFRNNHNRYDSDFYKMLMRDLRGLQFLKTLPEWNGKDISAVGGSMGGYRSMAMAANDKSITKVFSGYPWCVDLAGQAKFGRMAGWRPEYTEELAYFDGANLAMRVKCPIEIPIGLADYFCPPSGQMILYRNLNCPKSMTLNQNVGHGYIHGVDMQTMTISQP